jgi:hypothetical protein
MVPNMLACPPASRPRPRPYTHTCTHAACLPAFPTRYAKDEVDHEIADDLAEEHGWKLVHGDVFRPPAHLSLLSACVGTGMQLGLLGLCVIGLTIAGGGGCWQCTACHIQTYSSMLQLHHLLCVCIP